MFFLIVLCKMPKILNIFVSLYSCIFYGFRVLYMYYIIFKFKRGIIHE